MQPAKPKVKIDEDDPIMLIEITDPMQVPCCKKVFQKAENDGIYLWLKDHTSCPMCKKDGLTREQLIAVEKIVEVVAKVEFLITPCGHKFTKAVIYAWLDMQKCCPTDHLPLTINELQKVPEKREQLLEVSKSPEDVKRDVGDIWEKRVKIVREPGEEEKKRLADAEERMHGLRKDSEQRFKSMLRKHSANVKAQPRRYPQW